MRRYVCPHGIPRDRHCQRCAGRTVAALADPDMVEREQFETFVRTDLTASECVKFMARDDDGQYVMLTTRAAWAAWQARALLEKEKLN
jgi:hypothetical protein